LVTVPAVVLAEFLVVVLVLLLLLVVVVRMLIGMHGVGEKSTCACGGRACGRIILLL